MNWNDFESAWRNQEHARSTGDDYERLRSSLEGKHRKFQRRLFVRDIIEVAAGVLVVAVFSQEVIRHGISYWPVAIAILIVLAVMGFFIRERLRAHRDRVGPAAPLLAKMDADIAELEHQRRLLLKAGWWYVAPLMLAVVIVLGTIVGNHLDRLHAIQAQLFLAGYVIFCGLFAWAVVALNRRGARAKIEPQLAELRKLRDEIVSKHS